ncbi:hypothetical protein AB205_0071360 [Aquarana catesbeiana]|uniref:Uncharacterized protein n=1 Tax=Aquarana catesbeiana TaxID=8400 RepID=A0A2G9S1Q4_AQUCT|nr:hypothetical protein AB205_0071360 [Aquarana catesbeiana]
MSGRPPRRGRSSQATKRGQASSVSTVNSGGRGHAGAYCQVCFSDEEGGDDEVTDCTWVPERREEEEAQLQ